MQHKLFMTTVVLIIICLSSLAFGRVKLVTLPERGETSLHFDNPRATLVEEERVLTLKKGRNQIDFSWQGVNIDPDSIRIRMCSHPKKVSLISVSYPPNEAALVWKIYSQSDWEEKVRISYLLSGIDRLVTYQALANEKETKIELRSSLVLRNFSGEDFKAARSLLGYGQGFTTGIRNKETKKRTMFQQKGVTIDKNFIWDASKKPHDPEKTQDNVGIPVRYVLKNKKEYGLGDHPLWGGKIRLFQKDGHGSRIFLGEDRIGFTPIGEKIKSYIGDSRDVVVTQHRLEAKKSNIRRDEKGSIEVYDRIVNDMARIENFKDIAVTLTLVEYIEGQWEPIEFSHPYERINHRRLEFEINIPAGQEKELKMIYKQKNLFAGRYQGFNKLKKR